MDYYYYAEEEKQFGPFTIEELKSKRLKKSVLIWKEGMNDWAPGSTIEELGDILISEPPPLPSKKIDSPPPLPPKQIEEQMSINANPLAQITSPKYDLTYTKESIATIVGILLFITGFIILPITDTSPFNKQDINDDTLIFIWIGILGVRIFVTFWIVNIAKRQNRDSNGWGVFAFFFPSLALIIIGQLQKLRKDSYLKQESKTETITSSIAKANSDSEKITLVTQSGPLTLETDASGNIEKITFPQKYPSDKGELLIMQNDKNGPNYGDRVLLNGKIAEDGRYKLGAFWFIHVEKGVIKGM